MESLFKQYEGIFEEGEEEPASAKIKPERKEKGGNFALPDAVGKKLVKEVWVEFIKQVEKGVTIEAIHGSIIGKVRDILLAERASAEELGLHPFVHKKAKWDLKNWDKESLHNFYSKLVFAYHDARRLGSDLNIATEKILLAMGTNSESKSPAKIS